MKSCRECNKQLNNENCYPSYIRFGLNICILCQKENGNKNYIQARKDIISKLGAKCECCGLLDYDLLTIDHIRGGGNQEKKKLRGYSFLVALNKMDTNDLHAKYRCLCFNCNYCIGFWGICQHKI